MLCSLSFLLHLFTNPTIFRRWSGRQLKSLAYLGGNRHVLQLDPIRTNHWNYWYPSRKRKQAHGQIRSKCGSCFSHRKPKQCANLRRVREICREREKNRKCSKLSGYYNKITWFGRFGSTLRLHWEIPPIPQTPDQHNRPQPSNTAFVTGSTYSYIQSIRIRRIIITVYYLASVLYMAYSI